MVILRACTAGCIFYEYSRFVVWVNIAAAVEGVRRRVGEFNGSDQVVRMFSRMHKAFFR